MSQNLQGQAPSTIDVTKPDELRWWAKELQASEDQVRGAVSQVGNSPEDVRRILEESNGNGHSQGHTLFSADPELGSGVAGVGGMDTSGTSRTDSAKD